MIDFESLTESQKQAMKMISENSFLGCHRLWFNITKAEKWGMNWHHYYLAYIIEELVINQGKSVVINVPPASGKTELLSISLPVYSYIKLKDVSKIRILNTSFSNALVKENSLRVKSILKTEEFRELYGYGISQDESMTWKASDSKGRTFFELNARSLGGQITGGRGGYSSFYSGYVLSDDPDKPEDMFSDIKRKANHRKINNTLPSRRGFSGDDYKTPIIIIQQRLHVDDTTAFILDPKRGIGTEFEHVVIPALINQEYIDNLPDFVRQRCIDDICKTKSINGYWSFFPERFGVQFLFDLWNANEYMFMSQYMQTPITLGGSVFKGEWFNYYGEQVDDDGNKIYQSLPEFLDYRFITADTAQKTKSYNDYSVICEWGVKYDNSRKSNILYLLNMFRGKWEAPELRAKLKTVINDAYSRNSNINGNLRKILIEDKSSGTGLIQDLARESLPLPVTPVQRSTDKLTRALDAAPQIEMGKVYLPAGAPWITEFVSEHSLFTPNDSHKHDDIVDNTCDAVQEALLVNSSSFVDNLMFRTKR